MKMPKQSQATSVPRHVAIIMDGNNRWAKKRLLPHAAGHKAGVAAVRAAVEVCAEANVKVLTLFAFSSENWQRPITEVQALMRLFLWALKQEVKKLNQHNVQLKIIGDRSAFSEELQQAMHEAEMLTANNQGLILQIAANYGGQWDILQATQKIASQVLANEIQVDNITTDLIESKLVTSPFSSPDLCIRTGGERRVSNFLLWQLAYTELYFSDVLWPDFKHEAMQAALADYSARQRRFGKTSEQIEQGE
ncbi:isoprenyl transferase [Entomomonas sp. E2T0]|uniref:isoprenyl transferase n=1 Tax=Entomomonas sp. E2T0 TaxID=2930213 RepID=UPI0022285231|nr:isoprenyl transferase [Entomomonas sp. E2T0]UYZ84801.1 isoprenyl transferase [Entomomonas sp. E2T0]